MNFQFPNLSSAIIPFPPVLVEVPVHADVHEEQRHEGGDAVDDDVHVEDVDLAVAEVTPQLRGHHRDGVRGPRGRGQLEEPRDVVEDGEGEGWQDVGSTGPGVGKLHMYIEVHTRTRQYKVPP